MPFQSSLWVQKVFAFVSAGTDRKANAKRGGGLPQGGDLRLLEDGSERRGALVADLVVADTAQHG